jgi:NADH-quinone oxidoreductase subunit G
MHPIEDSLLMPIANHQIKYEVGTEEGVVGVLLYILAKERVKDKKIQDFIDEFDLGYLASETNISDIDIETIKKLSDKNRNKVLLIGSDVISNKRRVNISKLCALIEKYVDFKIMIIPTSTNTLGVSLICNLDKKEDGFGIGYNEMGDFLLSSCGDGDLDIPSLNQQEGTFTSMNKTVVPTNVAINFEGYCLNDIACKLGIKSKNSIDYTKFLPQSSGFKEIKFDSLECEFDNLGKEKIGYDLDNIDMPVVFDVESIEGLPEFNGAVVYMCEPIMQVNYNTYKSKKLNDEPVLKGSKQFSIATNLSHNDTVEIDFGDLVIKRKFIVDEFLKGTIALNPTFDLSFANKSMLSGYRYRQVKIKRAE